MATKADRYEGIDGLKAYAIIGIALMHVLANGEYGIGGFVFERLIPSFTNLVFLFMMVSGFGMCCGYYQKIVNQKISVEDFYKKRYIKIWPYFALLCALDFVISPSKESLFEVIATQPVEHQCYNRHAPRSLLVSNQETEEREQHVEHKNDCQCPTHTNDRDLSIRQKSLA